MTGKVKKTKSTKSKMIRENSYFYANINYSNQYISLKNLIKNKSAIKLNLHSKDINRSSCLYNIFFQALLFAA